MKDLIERLEKATGPDRELDAAIRVRVLKGAFPDETIEQRLEYARQYGRHYTASIDAALTLVPVNHTWWVDGESVNGAGETEPPTAHVMAYGADFRIADRSAGVTPAIALCISALKARAALSTNKGGPE